MQSSSAKAQLPVRWSLATSWHHARAALHPKRPCTVEFYPPRHVYEQRRQLLLPKLHRGVLIPNRADLGNTAVFLAKNDNTAIQR